MECKKTHGSTMRTLRSDGNNGNKPATSRRYEEIKNNEEEKN